MNLYLNLHCASASHLKILCSLEKKSENPCIRSFNRQKTRNPFQRMLFLRIMQAGSLSVPIPGGLTNMQNGRAVGPNPVFALRIGSNWCCGLMLLWAKQWGVLLFSCWERMQVWRGGAWKGWQRSEETEDVASERAGCDTHAVTVLRADRSWLSGQSSESFHWHLVTQANPQCGPSRKASLNCREGQGSVSPCCISLISESRYSVGNRMALSSLKMQPCPSLFSTRHLSLKLTSTP